MASVLSGLLLFKSIYLLKITHPIGTVIGVILLAIRQMCTRSRSDAAISFVELFLVLHAGTSNVGKMAYDHAYIRKASVSSPNILQIRLLTKHEKLLMMANIKR